APRKMVDRPSELRRLYAELSADHRAGLPDRCAAHEPEPHEIPGKDRDLEVIEHAERQEAAGLLAVFGDECHAAGKSRVGRVDLDLGATDQYLPGARRRDTEQRLGELAAARANEAGDPEDLARVQLETDVAKVGRQPEAASAQDRCARHRPWAGEDAGELAPDHHANHLLPCQVPGAVGADVPAVAE